MSSTPLNRALESPRNEPRRNWSNHSDDNRGGGGRGGGRLTSRDYIRTSGGRGGGGGGRRGGGTRHLQDRFVRGGGRGRSSGRSSTVSYFGRAGGGRDNNNSTNNSGGSSSVSGGASLSRSRGGRINFEPARGRGRGTVTTTFSSFADTPSPSSSQRSTYDAPSGSATINDGYIAERNHDNQYHDNSSQVSSDQETGARGGRGRSYNDNNSDFRGGRGNFDGGRGRGGGHRSSYDDGNRSNYDDGGSRSSDFSRGNFERSHSVSDRRTTAGRGINYDSSVGRDRGNFDREDRFEPSNSGRDDYGGRGLYKSNSGRGFYRGGRGRGFRGGRSGGRGRFDTAHSKRDDYQGRGSGSWRERNDRSSNSLGYEMRDSGDNSQEEGEWTEPGFHGDANNNDREWRQDSHRGSFPEHDRPPPPPPQDDFGRRSTFDRPPPNEDFNRGPRTYNERPPPPQDFERPPHDDFNRGNSFDRPPPPQDDFSRVPPRDRPPPPQDFNRGPPPGDYERLPPPEDFPGGPPPDYDRPPPPDDFGHNLQSRPPPQDDFNRGSNFDRPPLPAPVDDYGRDRNFDRPPPDNYGPERDFGGPPPHDDFNSRTGFPKDGWQKEPPPPVERSTYGQMADAHPPDWRNPDQQPQKQWGWNSRDVDGGVRSSSVDPPMSPRGPPHRSLPGRGFMPSAGRGGGGGGRIGGGDGGRGRGHFDDVTMKRKRDFEQHRESFTPSEPFNRRETFDQQEDKRPREDAPYSGRGGWNDQRSPGNRGRPVTTFDDVPPPLGFHEPPFRGGRGRGFAGHGFGGRGRGRGPFRERVSFTRPTEPQPNQMPSYASAADADVAPLHTTEPAQVRKVEESEKLQPKPPSPVPEPLPPSGFAVSLARLADVESQLDFAVAKHLQLVKQQKFIRAQIEKLEKLPVGIEAFQDDLEKHIANMKKSKAEAELRQKVEGT